MFQTLSTLKLQMEVALADISANRVFITPFKIIKSSHNVVVPQRQPHTHFASAALRVLLFDCSVCDHALYCRHFITIAETS